MQGPWCGIWPTPRHAIHARPTNVVGDVCAIDHVVVHRTRTIEAKDGNPINKVWVVSNSMMRNGGTRAIATAIKLTPARSVLGREPGDQICLSDADFAKLSGAFFAELTAKLVATAGLPSRARRASDHAEPADRAAIGPPVPPAPRRPMACSRAAWLVRGFAE